MLVVRLFVFAVHSIRRCIICAPLCASKLAPVQRSTFPCFNLLLVNSLAARPRTSAPAFRQWCRDSVRRFSALSLIRAPTTIAMHTNIKNVRCIHFDNDVLEECLSRRVTDNGGGEGGGEGVSRHSTSNCQSERAAQARNTRMREGGSEAKANSKKSRK